MVVANPRPLPPSVPAVVLGSFEHGAPWYSRSFYVLFMGQIGRELRWGIHYGKSYVGETGREGGAYGRGRTKGGRAEGGPIRRADANGIERRNGE